MGARESAVNQTGRRGVYHWLHGLWDRCIAPGCLVCGASCTRGEDLCPPCLDELPGPGPCCGRCAAPLPRPTHLPCGRCLRQSPAFDAVWAPFPYSAPLDGLIQEFKFGRRIWLGRTLARLMLRRPEGAEVPDCIVPVPLHPEREKERGFNQAAELALHLARHRGRPMLQPLERTRATRVQSRLHAGERQANLAGAFVCPRRLDGLDVALVDDVMTTGTTAGRCARALKRAGARRVAVWVCARA